MRRSPMQTTTARTASAQGPREINADAVASSSGAYALADGVGDDPRAARAARIAAAAAVRVGGGAVEAVLAAQAEVLAEAAGNCVLVVAVPEGDGYDIAWVGDVRAWAWTATGLRRLTTDHTVAQHFRDRGIPTTPRMEHIVTTSVRTARREQVGTARVAGPSLLVLTSDGVHKPLDEPVMTRLLRYSTAPAAALVEAATAAGSTDNATALVVECGDRRTMTLPAEAPDIATAALPVLA
ncbi:PP2C family protein-serine/threonine phosphatase [Actinokineospora sp. G85]|uniref:PP2C family protein-serine/threonine phosphatase n=1 Tax=Actinokineospora sp. G85 TaxID=3406626 RepID=UPI003C7891F9